MGNMGVLVTREQSFHSYQLYPMAQRYKIAEKYASGQDSSVVTEDLSNEDYHDRWFLARSRSQNLDA